MNMTSSMMGSQGLRGGAGGFSNRPAGGDIIPKGYNKGQLQQFTPEQMQLFSQLFGNVGQNSFLSRIAGGDEAAFEQMEAPAHRMFQEKLGQLGSRYSQLAPGAMSSQRSGGFQRAGGQLASDFAQDLSSQRMGLQRQALQDLFGMSKDLLHEEPYDRFLVEKPQQQKRSSFLQSLMGGLAPAVGAGLGSLLGPIGTAAGGALGSGLSSMFSGNKNYSGSAGAYAGR